ncbi:MAG: molybdopterin-dependent oxidoreductase [Halobacteriota archaeon]
MSEQQQSTDIDSRRRDFLKGLGATAAVGASGLGAASQAAQMNRLQVVDDPIGNYPYREWEDLYRDQWDWDSIGRSTHSVNCTGSCSWNVYVKNGQVWREEQAADYPRINQDLPDPNPRGCNKGACYKDYVHGAQRVKYPLKRTGERGEGKWKRISWDQALDEIAEEVLDTVEAGDYDGISGFTPIPAMSPVSFASGSRMINLLGGVSHSFYDWYSDLPPGQPQTYGFQTDNSESADWYNADYIIAWGSNINVTRIPDAKMFLESRYNGTKTVGVFSDYSQTAIHTDEFISPDPGTDAALALGMARTIIEEGLYDEAHVKEQSDMPLLVREDTGKFLRASEVADLSGNEKTMVMLDETGTIRTAPGSLGVRAGEFDPDSSIELDFDPQLSVDQTVDTTDGSVRVRTVWERLRDQLSDYEPDDVYEITGVGVESMQRIAREFADVEKGKIIHGKGVNDWFHNDLGNRSIQLVATLTGNMGRNGTNVDHYVGQEKIWTVNGWKHLCFPHLDKTGTGPRGMPTTLWTYYHSGITESDAKLKSRIEESLDKGWMPMYPEERSDGSRPSPSIFFVWRGNFYNQAKGNKPVRDVLWEKLDLVVDINFRMDTTAKNADYVLPAASHYEKHDLSMTDMHTWIHPFTPAIEPLGEAKPDWEVFRDLSERIQELARERDVGPIEDRSFDRTIEPASLYDDYVKDWLDDEAGALEKGKAAAEFILRNSGETNPPDSDEQITFDDTVEQPQRFLANGGHWTSDINEGEAFAPWKDFVQDKEPWPTYSGRQQYYIDHDWYLEDGEELPTYKEPLGEEKADEYPLRYLTPHGRWSMHSTWRDDKYMLRLNRGEPVLYIHPDDAESRDIEDGDTVRIYNDLAEIHAMAKYYPSSQRGSVRMNFSWEDYQFPDQGNFNSVTSMDLKTTQIVQYPEDTGEHLHFFPNFWGPTGVNSDARVEIELAEGGER